MDDTKNTEVNPEDSAAQIPSVAPCYANNLPFGMKHTPLGWGLMTEAFMSFASFALDSQKMKEQYKDATSVDLNEFKNQSLLEQMIDNSTGYAEDCLGRFLDWLVLNHWGKEEPPVEAKIKATPDSVTNRIKTTLFEHLNPCHSVAQTAEDINLNHRIIDDLGADSLDQVELVMALEEELVCEISDKEAEQLLTVADCVKYANGVLKA